MKSFFRLALAAVVLLGGVSCTKKLPEQELYGTWSRQRTEVSIKLKAGAPEALKAGVPVVEGIFKDYFGNVLKSFTFEANNVLKAKVLNPISQTESTQKGTYFYQIGEQLKVELTVEEDPMIGMFALFYGGMIGTQYQPTLKDNDLKLQMTPNVAKLLVLLILGNKELAGMVKKAAPAIPGMSEADFAALIEGMVSNIEDVEMTVNLQRAA
jgi:lipoprotein